MASKSGKKQLKNYTTIPSFYYVTEENIMTSLCISVDVEGLYSAINTKYTKPKCTPSACSPEKALLAAILERAIRDVLHPCGQYQRQEDKRSAEEFFAETYARDKTHFSLNDICLALDINKEWLLKQLKEKFGYAPSSSPSSTN